MALFHANYTLTQGSLHYRLATLGYQAIKSATPTALFHKNHTLTRGSLHYRLAILGYQKYNTYGVETFNP